MKICFIIYRIVDFQLLSPIIEEALKQNWNVECWHNYGHSKSGTKGYQFPDKNNCPKFLNGKPILKNFFSNEEIKELIDKNNPNVIIAQYSPFLLGIKPIKCKWLCVQHNFETFWMNGSEGIKSIDKILSYTDWWEEWASNYLNNIEGNNYSNLLKSRLEAVGVPEHDPFKSVNKDEIKKKWGIPINKKVVLYLPFVSISSKAFWPSKIFTEGNPFKKLIYILLKLKLNYTSHVLKGLSEKNVIKSVKRFCNKNNAYLVVKSRQKTKIADYIKKYADLAIYDESYYPSTILDVTSISDLCISYFSNSIFTSLRAGTPHLNINFSPEDFYLKDEKILKKRFQIFSQYKENPFKILGSQFTITISDLIKNLPEHSLSSYEIKSEIIKDFVKKFLQKDSSNSSENIIKVINIMFKNNK